jgi:hypothetical protein
MARPMTVDDGIGEIAPERPAERHVFVRKGSRPRYQSSQSSVPSRCILAGPRHWPGDEGNNEGGDDEEAEKLNGRREDNLQLPYLA